MGPLILEKLRVFESKKKAVPIIEKNVTVPLGTLISLAARDAGTFDASTNTGGLNGSIRFELDRPENKKVRAFFVL